MNLIILQSKRQATNLVRAKAQILTKFFCDLENHYRSSDFIYRKENVLSKENFKHLTVG